MAVVPVKINGVYVKDDNGLSHFEGQAKTKSEALSFSTGFAVGSKITVEEDWSEVILDISGTTKTWRPVGG